MPTMALMSISSSGRMRICVVVSAISSRSSLSQGAPGVARNAGIVFAREGRAQIGISCPTRMHSPPTPTAPSPAPDLRVHLALMLVQAAFGGFHVVAKAALSFLSPLQLAGLRVGLATPFLLLLAWRRDRLIPARRDPPRLALLGFLGVFANQIFFINGLRYTTAINAS